MPNSFANKKEEKDTTAEAIARDKAVIATLQQWPAPKVAVPVETALDLYEARVQLHKGAAASGWLKIITLTFIILAVGLAAYYGVKEHQVLERHTREVAALEQRLGDKPPRTDPTPRTDPFLRSYRI